MSDDQEPTQPIDSTSVVSELKPQASPTAGVAEIERLLGEARAAAGEAERYQQAASKSANDAELARTKAAEHLHEVETKRDSASSDADTIKSLAKKSATQSTHIDDGAKYADESRAELATSRQLVVDLKTQIEDHAQTVSEISKAMAALLAEMTQERTKLAPLSEELAALRTKAAEATSVAEQARGDTVSLRDAARESADKAAIDCKNIEDGKVYIDAERAKIDQYVSDGNARVAEATEAATAAQNSLAKIDTVSESADAVFEQIQACAEAIKELKTNAEVDRKTTEKLATIADSTEQRVVGYETELKRLNAAYENTSKRIEDLLPGAASAGLAHAFNEQKGKYRRPKMFWNILFFLALVGLVALGIVEIVRYWPVQSTGADGSTLTSTVPAYDQLLRSMLLRLPIVVALVWLALHAGRKSLVASQIEEDYIFKKVVSQSFEGYKKEFAGLDERLDPGSPLGTLCNSVVSIIGSPPSRVYDKHPNDPTPMAAVTDASKHVTAAIRETKAPSSPVDS